MSFVVGISPKVPKPVMGGRRSELGAGEPGELLGGNKRHKVMVQ